MLNIITTTYQGRSLCFDSETGKCLSQDSPIQRLCVEYWKSFNILFRPWTPVIDVDIKEFSYYRTNGTFVESSKRVLAKEAFKFWFKTKKRKWSNKLYFGKAKVIDTLEDYAIILLSFLGVVMQITALFVLLTSLMQFISNGFSHPIK